MRWWCGDGREQLCLFIEAPWPPGRARQAGRGKGSGGRAVGKGGMVGDADGERRLEERRVVPSPVGSFVAHDKYKGKRGD